MINNFNSQALKEAVLPFIQEYAIDNLFSNNSGPKDEKKTTTDEQGKILVYATTLLNHVNFASSQDSLLESIRQKRNIIFGEENVKKFMLNFQTKYSKEPWYTNNYFTVKQIFLGILEETLQELKLSDDIRKKYEELLSDTLNTVNTTKLKNIIINICKNNCKDQKQSFPDNIENNLAIHNENKILVYALALLNDSEFKFLRESFTDNLEKTFPNVYKSQNYSKGFACMYAATPSKDQIFYKIIDTQLQRNNLPQEQITTYTNEIINALQNKTETTELATIKQTTYQSCNNIS
jgi:hypothetical protein